MNPFTIEIIGYIAAVLGTFLMLPQVLKTVRTKNAEDLSWAMLIIYTIQCALWAVYGYNIQAMPVVICNAVAFCIGLMQLCLKKKYS